MMCVELSTEFLKTMITRCGFVCGLATSSSSSSRGKRICVLAFDVADTVSKGVKLFHSLSKENIDSLKRELYLKGVQELISTDMEELLSIAAADEREKLDDFLQEVIRFGNLCKDPKWHNLDQYFSSLDSNHSNHKPVRVDIEMRVQELSTLAERSYELHGELPSLIRMERDFILARGKSVLPIRIDQLAEKEGLVRSLKEKSLWTRRFEEIVEKLVDISTYIHQAISEAFGNCDRTLVDKELNRIPERLGEDDQLYACIIDQINDYVSLGRGTLDIFMTADLKTILHSRLKTLENVKEDLSICQIKAKMDKTLHWLFPLAENTRKAHKRWESNVRIQDWSRHKLVDEEKDPFRLQTLYHADKQKTNEYILELLVWCRRFTKRI